MLTVNRNPREISRKNNHVEANEFLGEAINVLLYLLVVIYL